MARHDIRTDPLPQMLYKKVWSPQVSSLRTALKAYSATSYSDARLDDMLENDMIYAARLAGLTVVNPT